MTKEWSYLRGRQQPTGVRVGRCGIPFGDTLLPPLYRALGSAGTARADSREAQAVLAFRVVDRGMTQKWSLGRGMTQKWSLGRGMTQKWSHLRGRPQPTGVRVGRCGIPFGDTLRPPLHRALGSVGAARAVMARRMVKALCRCDLMWRRRCHWRCQASSGAASGERRTWRRRPEAPITTAALSGASGRRQGPARRRRPVIRQESSTAVLCALTLTVVSTIAIATEASRQRRRSDRPPPFRARCELPPPKPATNGGHATRQAWVHGGQRGAGRAL